MENSKSAKLYLNDLDQKWSDYAILFIDGDALRRFNEISYDEGNMAIRCIAEVIKRTVRKQDKVFRWLSGDEFIVVAENITRAEAEALAERIRINVQEECSRLIFPVTISIGISIAPEDGKTTHDIIMNAERANKKAKRLGKNQCLFFDFEPMEPLGTFSCGS